MAKNETEAQSTENKILIAAKKVFLHKGYTGARMQEIADAAGINKALLHYYFRSKEKLFAEIMADAFNQLLPTLAIVVSEPVNILEKIERFIDAYISVVLEHPYIPGFVIYEINQHPEEFFEKTCRLNCEPD